VHGHLQADVSGLHSFGCHYNVSELSVMLWLDDQLLCPATVSAFRVQLPAIAGQLLHVRLEVIQRGSGRRSSSLSSMSSGRPGSGCRPPSRAQL
jgi:hypothetical protein